jgi:DNA polymerase-3 subunit alpha
VPKPFVHLHLHTQYSLLDGAIKHNPLFERAKAMNMPAVAQTDHGNLFGTIEFYEKARANDVKPIIGCEVYIAGKSRFDKEGRERTPDGFDAISHLLLLAMDGTGYRNLMYLVSKAYLEGFYYRPRIDMDLLRERSEGLIATSGCLSSPVPRAILLNEMDRAWRVCEEFKRIFGDRYYLELQRHGIPAQDTVNAELAKMSLDLGVPLVATNDAHYLEEGDHVHHDALLCIGTAANLDDPKRFRFDGHGFHVKDGDEMREVFHDHPSAIENTLEIAERCNLEIPMGDYHMPEYQVPSGTTLDDAMEEEAWAGLRRRLELAEDEPIQQAEYAERMKHELAVIRKMGFAGYFLIVADFIHYARRNGIPVGPGRGSSAGSLVAYGMGITGVDPIHYGILFERFLNPERVSMPDIDVDFCMRGRDQVIRYVAEKYGSGVEEEAPLDGRYDGVTVAQIVTFGTLQARAVIRDVGRVLGMSFGDVDRVAKLIPEVLGITLKAALKQSPELRARIQADGQIKQLIETALSLEGLTRHASKHAAGVVIGNKPLIETVPLYRDPRSGDVMSQYNMVCVEKVGLIKFDFLGLRTLTVMADAEKMIRANGKPDFRYEEISLDDEKTFAMLCAGDTEGVFQVESAGMTDLVMQQKPRVFNDLVPLNALYRPGPLGSGMVEDYINRRKGNTKVDYVFPEMEEVTAETLGVIVYQDQVLQIAQRVAGYSLGEADELRRAMGKKKHDVMAQHREQFVKGAVERNLDERKAAELYDRIAEFAAYAFPKAHAVAYSLIVYQTAWLKANHPHEFMAALLSIESGNHEKLGRYIAHCRERGIQVLPPDVNESSQDFSVVDASIRFGFAGIKNVGAGAIEHMLQAREAEGRFTSLFDFVDRIDGRKANRRVVEALVKCGAFDSLHPNRNAVWCSLDAALERGAAAQRDRAIGQESLFGGLTGASAVDAPKLADVASWTEREQLAHEKELLGFYVTGHPLGEVAQELARFTDITAATTEGRFGREVRAGGLLTGFREHRTRNTGKRMGYGTLEDLEGCFELVFFADVFPALVDLLRRARAAVEAGADGDAGPIPLVVRGTLQASEPARIVVRDVIELKHAEQKLAATLRVRLLETELGRDRMLTLRKLLEAHPGDCGVNVHVTIPGESETVLCVGGVRGVDASDALCRDVDGLFGRAVADRGFR